MSIKSADVSKEKLMQDLRAVVADADELLRATAGQAGEKVAAVRERVQENVAAAKQRLASMEDEAMERARQAAKVTDEYVHDNPWTAIGVAASVGIIVGMLIGRGGR
ncbi:MAG TPA: DUF883 family protein [Gallionella sp.]|nr:DUF883 family protein [Gallionella sp.]